MNSYQRTMVAIYGEKIDRTPYSIALCNKDTNRRDKNV